MTSNRDRFRPNKFGFELRLAIFQQHGDHLAQVIAQFFKSCAVRVCPRKSWHVTDEQFCLRIALDDGSESSHARIVAAGVLSRNSTCHASILTRPITSFSAAQMLNV